MTASDRSWQPAFVALAAIWGASFLFIKVAVDDIAPVDVALVRCALGALVLVGLVAWQRSWPVLAWPVGVAALLFNSVPFVLYSYGETHVSSVVAGLFNATTPLLTMFFAMLFLPQERPTRAKLAAVLVGFVGVVLVLGPWRSLSGGELAGELMCLGAATCYGLGFVHMRRSLTERPESGTALAAGQLIWATAQLALVTVFVGGAPGAVGVDAVGCLLALGALGSGVAYVLNFRIVRLAGPTTASTVTYLIPLFSTVLGMAVLGEDVTWNQPLGAAIVLTAVARSSRSPVRIGT